MRDHTSFDAAAARDVLTEAGMPLLHAKAIVHAIQQSLGNGVTKADLTQAMMNMEMRLDGKISSLREELVKEILTLDKKVEVGLKGVEVSLKDLLVKLSGLILTVGGLIIAALKFLH